MPLRQTWTPLGQLRAFSLVLAKKMAFIALGWVAVYFISQPFRVDGSILMLFAPMIGGLAGITIGWYFAENAVEDAGFSGLFLWCLLVAASWLTMWAVEGLLHLITGWGLFFGGWMLVSSSMLMAMASAVWRASADG